MAELGFQNVVNQLRENREKEEEAKAKADQVANNNIESLKKVIERSNTNSEKGREIKAKAEAKLKTLEEEQKQNNAFAVVQSEQVKELKESKEALKIIGERVTAAGGKAEENAEYNEASRKIQEQEFKLRMDSATNKGAEAEIEKERDAFRKKEGTLLQKISLAL